MESIRLQSGQTLGCEILEITSVPECPEGRAQEDFLRDICGLLQSLHRLSSGDNIMFELLWAAQAVQGQPHAARVRLFWLVRAFGADERSAQGLIQSAFQPIKEYLAGYGYKTNPVTGATMREQGLLPGISSTVCGVLKAERMTIHMQSVIPYYYVEPLEEDGNVSFAALSRLLADMPGALVSFQLFPTVGTAAEELQLSRQCTLFDQILNGTQLENGQPYRDILVKPALDALMKTRDGFRRPMFTYNILTFGTGAQCSALNSEVINILQGSSGAQFSAVNLSAEKLDLSAVMLWYPWTLHKKMQMQYRNWAIWQQYGQYLPRELNRLPYLVTSAEAVRFFRVPPGSKNLVGIPIHKAAANAQQFNESVTSEHNIQFGPLSDDPTGTTRIGCPPKQLTKHMLVVGKPGCGKTTFSVYLLMQLKEKNIPFLAIEPTKTEYRGMIEAIPDLQIFTPGNNGVSPFVINPFIPPRGITVEQYVPSLASAFKAAFSMPSPLDTFFQAAIREAYTEYGWRDYSTAQDANVRLFGLHEFILVFRRMIAQEKYSAEVKGNLQSGGIVRLRNLIEQNANIYDTVKSVPLEDLLSRPTVLELNAIDSQEQKAVLIALLLINICVYTKHNMAGNGELKNAILIDEAHVIFKAQTGEGENSAVRSLENMLAEIRSYGTSIIIADQSPAAVGREVVKNTDIKVLFQMVDTADRNTVAEATGMREQQADHIPQLDVGEAFISTGQLKEPVLVKTPDVRARLHIRPDVTDAEIKEHGKYWASHGGYLVPFNECAFCKACDGSCDMRVRSDAGYYADRFLQIYGTKITDSKTFLGYLKAVDRWLDGQVTDPAQNSARLHGCTKIRMIRRCMQKMDLPYTGASYDHLLDTFLNGKAAAEAALETAPEES